MNGAVSVVAVDFGFGFGGPGWGRRAWQLETGTKSGTEHTRQVRIATSPLLQEAGTISDAPAPYHWSSASPLEPGFRCYFFSLT